MKLLSVDDKRQGEKQRKGHGVMGKVYFRKEVTRERELREDGMEQ